MLVTQGVNTYTLPQAVAFTTRPVIQSITSPVCAPDFLNPTSGSVLLKCVAGDTITLIGAFFAPPETLAVLVLSGPTNASCINPTILSNWTLSCALPNINNSQALALLDVSVKVVVIFNSSVTSNAVTVGLYRSPGSLGVTSVSGCQRPDAMGRGAQGCLTNDLLTIRGANLNATGMAVEMYSWTRGCFTCASSSPSSTAPP